MFKFFWKRVGINAETECCAPDESIARIQITIKDLFLKSSIIAEGLIFSLSTSGYLAIEIRKIISIEIRKSTKYIFLKSPVALITRLNIIGEVIAPSPKN